MVTINSYLFLVSPYDGGFCYKSQSFILVIIQKHFFQKFNNKSTWALGIGILWYFLHIPNEFYLHMTCYFVYHWISKSKNQIYLCTPSLLCRNKYMQTQLKKLQIVRRVFLESERNETKNYACLIIYCYNQTKSNVFYRKLAIKSFYESAYHSHGKN